MTYKQAINYLFSSGFSDEQVKEVVRALNYEPCEDCISRQAVLDTTICDGISCNECSFNKSGCILDERISKLPPVIPQPKTGHEITILQNRCYLLTKGAMCAFCQFECAYKESEDME